MNVNFNGYNENAATFEADSSVTKTGTPVKMSGDGKVAACVKNDVFCGVCAGINDGYALVVLDGYVTMNTDAKITSGYVKLAAAADGKVAANDNGREYLVIDSTDSTVGFIL